MKNLHSVVANAMYKKMSIVHDFSVFLYLATKKLEYYLLLLF